MNQRSVLNKDGSADFQAKTLLSGVLVELSTNDLQFFSPSVNGNPVNLKISTVKSLKNQAIMGLDTSSDQGQRISFDESLSCLSAFLSPSIGDNRKDHGTFSTKSTQSVLSKQTSKLVDEKCGSSIDWDSGYLNIGMESPSSWKLPWFINSLLPVHRIDTDVTFEDIGYIMSPGEGTYDAVGLMRQFSEHTAAIVAEAHEILRSGSLEVELDDRYSNKDNFSKEDVQADKELEGCHKLPTIMAEARALDFSECVTPVRKTAK